MDNCAIVWFRNDLRLHDNEVLTEALKRAKYILPVYVFDERVFNGKTKFGFEKCEKFRTKFIIESVQSLKSDLQKLGSDLIIRKGIPEDEIFKLAQEVKSSWVYCNRERTSEEVYVQDQLEQKLWTIGQELRYERGKMLFYTSDLPFPIGQVPDTFAIYRKEVENIVEIRKPLVVPLACPFPKIDIDRGEVPTLQNLGKKPIIKKHEESKKLLGGENYGITQMAIYFDTLNDQSKTSINRDDISNWEFSTKLSSWLSLGCISPKMVYEEMTKRESDISKKEEYNRIFHALLRRDFLRLMGKKYGNKIFQENGIYKRNQIGIVDWDKFDRWSSGKTGIPFIDANMRQLNETGYMSFRGRINTAGYLVNEMGLNWLIGAEYFESLLIDYDPCSNYGNWNLVAGVSSDQKEDRKYNIDSQAKKYDTNGEFVKYWLS